MKINFKKLAIFTTCFSLIVGFLLWGAHNIYSTRAQKNALRSAELEGLFKESLERGEMHIRQGRPSDALDTLLKAESTRPDDYRLQYDLGLAYELAGDLKNAIKHFEKALVLKDDYSPARNSLGIAYQKNNEFEKAIEQFEIAASNALYATPHYAYNNIGIIYYKQIKYSLAESYFKKALEINPKFGPALLGLAQTYIATERTPEAIRTLEFAVQEHPKSSKLYTELSNAYLLEEKYNKAYETFMRIAEIDPDGEQGKKALANAQKVKTEFID